MKYNPDKPVNPKLWLAADEVSRQAAVVEYHRRARVKMPNVHIHATIHTIIENQIAAGDQYPVAAVLDRLMRQDGLDRHEAIHCIGSVLTDFIYQGLKDKTPGDSITAGYFAALEKLTAAAWRRRFAEHI